MIPGLSAKDETGPRHVQNILNLIGGAIRHMLLYVYHASNSCPCSCSWSDEPHPTVGWHTTTKPLACSKMMVGRNLTCHTKVYRPCHSRSAHMHLHANAGHHATKTKKCPCGTGGCCGKVVALGWPGWRQTGAGKRWRDDDGEFPWECSDDLWLDTESLLYGR